MNPSIGSFSGKVWSTQEQVRVKVISEEPSYMYVHTIRRLRPIPLNSIVYDLDGIEDR